MYIKSLQSSQKISAFLLNVGFRSIGLYLLICPRFSVIVECLVCKPKEIFYSSRVVVYWVIPFGNRKVHTPSRRLLFDTRPHSLPRAQSLDRKINKQAWTLLVVLF
jgi:hypothetical protein